MQSIIIEDRKAIKIVGATRILSSTSNQASVEMNGNNLILSGTNLEITKLDLENGEVFFCGELNGLKFANKSEKTPLIKRLFR